MPDEHPIKARLSDEERRKRRRASSAKWKAANANKVRESLAKWKAENKERTKETAAKWHARCRCDDLHRAEARERVAKWVAANRERKKESDKNYRTNNIDREKARRAKRYAKDPAAAKAYVAKWSEDNPEKAHAYKRKAKAIRRAIECGSSIGDRDEIAAWEKGWRTAKAVTCYWCDRKFPGKKCHADHVVPLTKGGSHSRSNLVVACATCNLKKQAKEPKTWNKSLVRPRLFV